MRREGRGGVRMTCVYGDREGEGQNLGGLTQFILRHI